MTSGTVEQAIDKSFIQRVQYLLDCILWMVIIELLVTRHKNRIMAATVSILQAIKSLYFSILCNHKKSVYCNNCYEWTRKCVWKKIEKIAKNKLGKRRFLRT